MHVKNLRITAKLVSKQGGGEEEIKLFQFNES